jgi:hypothetical protein
MLLEPGSEESVVPRFDGTARLVGQKDTVPLPYTVSASFKTAGRVAALENLAVEAGEGSATLRLTGAGQLALDERRLSIALEGRRVDLDGLIAAYGEAPAEQRRAWRPLPGFPIDLTLKLDGLVLAGEELASLTANGTIAGDRLALERLAFTAPGQTRATGSGEASLAAGGGANGRVTLSTRSADRLASYLGRFGIADVSGDALAGRPLDASADIVAAHPVTSLRNLQVRLGDATLTGALRHTAAEASTRARIDAQLAIQGLDLETLPQVAGLIEAGRSVDLGLILDARNVGYGAGERGGRIAARIASEGSELTIDRLEIENLAGASANLRGRIGPDGAGRISGQLRARRAAPLIDLVGRASLGGLAELIPPFMREAPLDAAVSASRASSSPALGPALTTRIDGSAGGAALEAEITSLEGRVNALRTTLSTSAAGNWLGAPFLNRPARIELQGGRDASGRLGLRLAGDIAGLRIATTQPFVLSPRDNGVESGEVTLVAADMAPLLAAIGQKAAAPVALDVKARLGRREAVPRIELTGQVGGSTLEADLAGQTPRDLSGRVVLGRVSLPWIASALALGPIPEAPAGSAWTTARFPEPPPLIVGGTVAVRAATADLGRGLSAQGAEFTLATNPDGFAIRDFGAAFTGGRLSGTLSLNRQGGLAAVIGEGTLSGVSLPDLVGAPVRAGRLSGNLRFGGSGESPAGIVANLGGAGRGRVQRPGTRSRGPRGDHPNRGAGVARRRYARPGASRRHRCRGVRPRAAPGPVARGQATLVSGGLRISPLVADAGAATWQGSAAIDFRTLTLDVRGAFGATAPPRTWSGPAPYLTLGWAGPIGRAARTLDVGPLSNGLASVVLTRELERIEVFELDAAERGRLRSRVEMDRARRAAAEEAARLARQREDAERQRLEAERQRLEAERARAEAEQIMSGGRPAEGPGSRFPTFAPPLDIRPPRQGGAAPGG